MDKRRRAGVLMPLSALPAKYGIGTLGSPAENFIDFLHDSGARVWQILPLQPTGYGDSPYQSCDSRALNYYFIDLDKLCEQGLLTKEECDSADLGENDERINYYKLFLNKATLLRKAFARFDKRSGDWRAFLKNKTYEDFGVFMALKDKYDHKTWTDWQEYSIFDADKIKAFTEKHKKDVEFWIFTQYVFLKQWNELRAYARQKNVEIMGDMPIYVSFDSVETWKYGKELFLLGENGRPSLVAGVPPDAFSDDGQLWGNPVYDWAKMRDNGYKWWHDRIDYALNLHDIVRIDHFRGFDRFYAIPATATDAKNGKWMPAPGAELFLGRENGNIVAEDLGIIDEGVIKMTERTGYPGMKVLEFAFDGSPYNTHKPRFYTENCVAYTGTHDNDPLLAFVQKLDERQRQTLVADLAAECDALGFKPHVDSTEDVCEAIIELLFASKAFLAVLPLSDLLLKGERARINRPSTLSTDNWSFRFSSADLNRAASRKLKSLIEKSGRL